MKKTVDVAIIGAGTAGLNAMGQARRSGKSFVLINGGELGTTCARVGCMPSKALIQIADTFHGRTLFNRFGIDGKEALTIDAEETMKHVQDIRDILVDRVLEGSTDELEEDQFIEGYAKFTGSNTLQVNEDTIEAKSIVIANGSRPIVPTAWEGLGDRLLTTDSFFEMEDLPQSVAVIGLGVIGLELGQALSRLGVSVTGFDILETIGGLTDMAVNKVAIDIIGKEFPLQLGQAAEISENEDGTLTVSAGEHSVQVERVLACLGRRSNMDNLDLQAAGIEPDASGIPQFNPNTMQIADLPIYLAGDTNADRPILHEAGEEGRIAGWNASHEEITAFKRKTPIGITFCDPNIVTVGQDWASLQDDDNVVVGEMPLGPLGRALIMGKNKGLIRIYARKSDGLILGATMMSPKGENLAHLLAWAIQREMTVHQILQMPFYHPVVEEILQSALQRLLPQLDIKTSFPADLRPLTEGAPD